MYVLEGISVLSCSGNYVKVRLLKGRAGTQAASQSVQMLCCSLPLSEHACFSRHRLTGGNSRPCCGVAVLYTSFKTRFFKKISETSSVCIFRGSGIRTKAKNYLSKKINLLCD